MRRGQGGERVGAPGVRDLRIRASAEGRNCLSTTLARDAQRSRTFRNSTAATQTATASRVSVPPALRAISAISSCGLSQESMVSNTGPDRYQPSHNRTRSLRTRRFMLLSVALKVPWGKFGASTSFRSPRNLIK